MRSWPAHSHHGGQSYKEHKLRVSETKEAVTSFSRQNSLLTSTKLQLSNHLQTQSSPAKQSLPAAQVSNRTARSKRKGQPKIARQKIIVLWSGDLTRISGWSRDWSTVCNFDARYIVSDQIRSLGVWNLSQKVWISNEICGSYRLLSSPFKTNVALKTFQELHASLLPKDGALQRDGWGVPSSVVSQVRSLLGEPSPRYLSMLNLGYLLARMKTMCLWGLDGFRVYGV